MLKHIHDLVYLLIWCQIQYLHVDKIPSQ